MTTEADKLRAQKAYSTDPDRLEREARKMDEIEFPEIPRGWSLYVSALYLEGKTIPAGWGEELSGSGGHRRFVRHGTRSPKDGWGYAFWTSPP